jgi:hypothetical protein
MSWLISLTRPPSLPPNALTCMWGKGIAGLYVRGPDIYFFFFPNDLQKFSLSRCEIHLSLLSTRLYAPEKDLWVAEVGIHDWTLRRHPPSWYCYSGNWSDCKRAWYWSYTDCKQAHGQTCTSTSKPTMHWNCFRRTAQHTITIWSLFGTYRRRTGVTMPRLGEPPRGTCEVWKRGRRRGRRSTQLAPCKRNQEADSGMQTIRLKWRATRADIVFSQNKSRDCLVSSALLRNGTSL